MPAAATDRAVVNEINVTPMIDVLLVLLISFFLMQKDRNVIPAVVPAPQLSIRSDGAPLVLELTAAGGFRLNGQPIPDLALEAQLAAVFEARPVKLLFVDAAGDRTYQEVVTAMDRARGAGAQVVALMPAPDRYRRLP
jgi:biopolymer transport protein TolR